MAKATGLGGVFLRANDPQSLYDWYARHLGLTLTSGTFIFEEEPKSQLVLSFFPRSSEYFPTSQPAMLNFQVDDLDGVLDRLVAAGVEVDEKREQYEYGRFGWFKDPEGNRVELWEQAG